MADTKISALVAASVAAVANELAINEAGTSKKISVTQLVTLLQTLGMPRVTRLTSQHANSTTSGTIVTDLTQTLEVGTFAFDYRLIVRSATATVSPLYGVQFLGTGAPKMWMQYADASATLLAALNTADNDSTIALGFAMAQAKDVKSAAAPNMGHAGGVGAINTDIMIQITGIMVVTASGDLQLYHASETATATSIEVGSSLIVHRTA